MKRWVILIAFLALVLSGCQHGSGSGHTVGGAALGGIAGGVIGSQIGKGSGQTAAIIGGTLAGAALGAYIGSYMDRMDRMDRKRMAEALETKPSGATSEWYNPDTETGYSVTPTRTFKESPKEEAPDRYCREYTTEVKIGGETEKAFGTACRMEDGTWEIVN